MPLPGYPLLPRTATCNELNLSTAYCPGNSEYMHAHCFPLCFTVYAPVYAQAIQGQHKLLRVLHSGSRACQEGRACLFRRMHARLKEVAGPARCHMSTRRCASTLQQASSS